MKRLFCTLCILYIISSGCSKDTANSRNNAINIQPDTLNVIAKSLVKTWSFTKFTSLTYINGDLSEERTSLPGVPPYKIVFTEELFQNIANTKKVYDYGTGLALGYLPDNFSINSQNKWAVSSVDSLTIDTFTYFIKKSNSNELELMYKKEISPNKYSISTWYLAR